MSSCKEIQLLLGRYVDHELAAAEVNRVDNHLSVCERCVADLRLAEREAELLRAALAADEVPAGLGAGLWDRLRAERPRRTGYWWYGLAAAASIAVALLVGALVRPARPEVQVARITTCSGPLEVRTSSGAWAPVAAYSMLHDGDRVRCGMERPGAIILGANVRIDLDVQTEVAFLSDGSYGQFRLMVARGRIRGDVRELRRHLNVVTPVADAMVMSEESGESGRAEFEIRLAGIPESVGWLDRASVLPAAYAGAAPATMEVIVHHGSVVLVNLSKAGTAVTPGHRVVVASRGAMPEPERFEAGSLPEWWGGMTLAAVSDRPPEPLPLPRMPDTGAGASRAVDPIKEPEKVFEPGPIAEPKGVEPAAKPEPAVEQKVEGPPAPEGLAAKGDIASVVLTWKPVAAAKEPVVEYGIYRRGAVDTDFALVGRVPASERGAAACRFVDEGLSIGAEYQYSVAAAYREHDGQLVEGKMAAGQAAAPADFQVYYTGGDSENLAMIVVEKLYDGALRRQTFAVRKRDSAQNMKGEIGEPLRVVFEPVRGTTQKALIDFTTGYRLVDIRKAGYEGDVVRKRGSIVIENDLGVRREIEQIKVR